jgi:thiamine biosynthesis lipoprotein
MSRSRLSIATILGLLLLSGCPGKTDPQSAQFLVFGTLLDVSVQGTDAETADRAFAELQKDFQEMHRDWHAWEPGELTRINEAFAAGRSAPAPAGIIELVRRSQDIETRSGGYFNAAIGGLIRLWGFHTSIYPIAGPPPSHPEIREWLAQKPSSTDIEIDGALLRSTNPAVELDFGGIAKGYALDLALNRLRAMGIENAIVNAGGDLMTMGDHGDRAWRVAIRQPGGGIIGTLETRGDEAVFTSGVYERYRQDETERYPHILDPRTGWPVDELTSVTVVSSEGLLADAAATALIVAGPENWKSVARALALDQVMLVDGEGNVLVTARMKDRVRFEAEVEPRVLLLD